MPTQRTPSERKAGDDPGADLARAGRRVGVALFWLLAAYVVGGAALSIIPSLYGAGRPSAPRTPPGVCARRIDALERDLADARLRCVDTVAAPER